MVLEAGRSSAGSRCYGLILSVRERGDGYLAAREMVWNFDLLCRATSRYDIDADASGLEHVALTELSRLATALPVQDSLQDVW